MQKVPVAIGNLQPASDERCRAEVSRIEILAVLSSSPALKAISWPRRNYMIGTAGFPPPQGSVGTRIFASRPALPAKGAMRLRDAPVHEGTAMTQRRSTTASAILGSFRFRNLEELINKMKPIFLASVCERFQETAGARWEKKAPMGPRHMGRRPALSVNKGDRDGWAGSSFSLGEKLRRQFISYASATGK